MAECFNTLLRAEKYGQDKALFALFDKGTIWLDLSLVFLVITDHFYFYILVFPVQTMRSWNS